MITCNKGLNEPRRANLKGIMAVKTKPIAEEASENVAEPDRRRRRSSCRPRARPGRIVGEGAAAVPALIDALRNEAQVL